MDLRKVIRAQEEIPASQSGSPTTQVAWIGQKTPSQNCSQSNSMFHSVKGPGKCYIIKQTLYFHEITLSKVIRDQERILTSQRGSPITKLAWIGQKKCPAKITPKIAHFALSGDPIAVTSAANNFVFIKWPWVKLSELKRGFLHHKVAPRPRKWPELVKNTPSQNPPQNSTFGSVKASDRCQMDNQPLYFH